jgi:hypothetical protein
MALEHDHGRPPGRSAALFKGLFANLFIGCGCTVLGLLGPAFFRSGIASIYAVLTTQPRKRRCYKTALP